MTPASLVAAAMKEAEKATDTTGEWPVRVGGLPTDGDQAISLVDFGGNILGMLHRGGTIINAGVQVKVRALDYDTAYSKADELKKWMDNLVRLAVSAFPTVQLNGIHVVTPIIHGGKEQDTTRESFLFNTHVSIKDLT